MDLGDFQLTWFDLVVLGLVAYGIFRGRKRGMSEELLDVFQWLCIVVLGALLYSPLGKGLTQFAGFPLLLSNILAYAGAGVSVAGFAMGLPLLIIGVMRSKSAGDAPASASVQRRNAFGIAPMIAGGRSGDAQWLVIRGLF